MVLSVTQVVISPAEGAPGSHVKCSHFEHLCCRSWCCYFVYIVLTEAWQAHHETTEYSHIILKKIWFPSQLSPSISTLKMFPLFKSLQDTSNIICMLTSVVTLVFIVWLWHFTPVLISAFAVEGSRLNIQRYEPTRQFTRFFVSVFFFSQLIDTWKLAP